MKKGTKLGPARTDKVKRGGRPTKALVEGVELARHWFRGRATNSKLTEKACKEFLDSLRITGHIGISAQKAGLGRSTVNEWMKAGRDDPEGPYGFLIPLIERAIGHARHGSFDAIRKAGDRDWKAHAYILDRTEPDFTKRIEVSGRDGGPVQVEAIQALQQLRETLDGLSEEELEKLTERTKND